ncbi:MAG: polyphosphate kinase [Spirochaetes bacterium]|nr:MAG: polyphosphate kinase [Spirochaetota bacterium]
MQAQPMFNRELSWLEFNDRVLREALKPEMPLLERLKFLGIISSNFDEFFMVRVAALKTSIRKGDRTMDQSGMSPVKIYQDLSIRAKKIVDEQYHCLVHEVLPGLAKEGIAIIAPQQWTQAEKRYLDNYFSEFVFPLITPLRIERDAFPSVGNLQIHCIFEMESETGETLYALAQVPKNSGRFVPLPALEEAQAEGIRFALIEDLILSFASRLFPGHSIRNSLVFKITRDADSGVDEERQDDFLAAMEEILAGRQNSTPVRLKVSGRAASLLAVLQQGLELGEYDTYRVSGPIDLAGFYELATLEDQHRGKKSANSRLRDKPWEPIQAPAIEGASIWDELERGDRLLHLPYDSFSFIQRFLDEAADDPSVLAIKMTLYRTSGDSAIVKALIRAARNRKQVSVVVELKARFDEERNITWASTLEQAGAIVTYGVATLKVHAKLAMVVRKVKDGSIRKYLHLSTGNYNEKTARTYSDLSLFTMNEDLAREASALFNILTGYSTIQTFTHMAIAPFELKKRILSLIEREIQRSSPESPGLIEAKLNACADNDVIHALYAASKSGVRIRLNIRGACTLVPGLPGISDTIEVRSNLGRYLEHARIFHFRNGGNEEVYLASADWLPRNLERRVELMFPILDEKIQKECIRIFDTYFQDNSHAYRLLPTGSYESVLPGIGEKIVYAQEVLYKKAKRMAEIAEAPLEELTIRRRYKNKE